MKSVTSQDSVCSLYVLLNMYRNILVVVIDDDNKSEIAKIKIKPLIKHPINRP